MKTLKQRLNENCLPSDKIAEQTNRTGASLSEVLVALLIMSIGLVALAALFPVSVLKTARANQLTCGTDLAYNARSAMKIFPQITNAQNPPYLFDPLATAVGRTFPMSTSVGSLPRNGVGFDSSLSRAQSLCTGPDTWTSLHEGTISNITATDALIDGLSGVPSLSFLGPERMRIQIFYNGGKNSTTRMITAIKPDSTLVWTELFTGVDVNNNQQLDPNTLPASPSGFVYESARLEVREMRYTWMLTVRKNGTTGDIPATDANVDVVVYYGRGFTNQEEQTYGIGPGANRVAGSSIAYPPNGPTFDPRIFTVTWPVGSEPFLKRGGWVLDARNGFWYQIADYTDPLGGTSSKVTLLTPMTKQTDTLMFARGVVNVY